LITIYYSHISERSHNRLMESYLPFFYSEYQNRLFKYRRWQDAQLSLLGRVLLVKGLDQLKYKFDESKLEYTNFNKPYLEGHDVHFNISHSGNIVVCALTKLGEIGIDIEKIEPIEFLAFKSQMTANEWRMIDESKNPKRSFYTYWSQKEAVIKAHGEGLSIPLKSFEVKNNIAIIECENFYVKEISICDEYSCLIASRENIETTDIKIIKINF